MAGRSTATPLEIPCLIVIWRVFMVLVKSVYHTLGVANTCAQYGACRSRFLKPTTAFKGFFAAAGEQASLLGGKQVAEILSARAAC